MQNQKIIKFHKKKILKNGFTIFKNAISKKECDKLKNIGKKIYKKYKNKNKIKNSLEQTIYNLHNKNEIYIKYICYKKLYGIVQSVLSEGSYNNECEINIRQIAMRNPKKGHAQQLHNDTRIAGCKYPLVIHIIYMLDDFTEKNGATRVVSKSHLRDNFAQNNKIYKNEIKLTGKKGDAIIFNASTWHGSSKKILDDDRWGMIYSYSRWFLKPDFNYCRNTPKKIFNKLTKEQKKLLGFYHMPPDDEFTRSSATSDKAQKPINYKLPI